MYSVGKKIGPYTVVKQLWDQNAYYCTNDQIPGFVCAVTHEELDDVEESNQNKPMKYFRVVYKTDGTSKYQCSVDGVSWVNVSESYYYNHKEGEKMADNFKAAYNTSSYGYQLGGTFADDPFIASNINNIQTPKPMTRLTTSGDWTILLEDGKLVAVDSNGRTIRAVGSLLSADGKAWMWHGAKLWSGALELTDTEAGVREKERLNKIRELRLKQQKLNEKQDNAIRAINIKFDKLRENL